jgi:integrase
MARPRAPKIDEFERKDGSTYYTTRLMVDGERQTIHLGDERDGATRLSAQRKLKDVLEDIRLGCWQPDGKTDASRAATREREPGFAEVAGRFLEHKRSRQLRTSTIDRLTWAIEAHLVPFFGTTRPSRITEQDVMAFSDHEILQRGRIAQLRSQGKYLSGPGGGALRELSDVTINSLLIVLTGVLGWAAEKGWGERDANPAAGWRLRERPRLTAALESDELADLIAAAATPRPARRQCPKVAARADLIVRLRDDDGLPWKAVAEQVEVAVPTAIYHYQQLKNLTRFAVDGARAKADEVFLTALSRTGARVTELCDLTVGEVDLRHAKFRIPDAKTAAGVREVDMTPALVQKVARYFKARGPLAATDPAFPDGNGRRRNKDQANKQVIAPAMRLANELRAERGERALPPVTPHVLRHTYITLAFEAGQSVPFVMQQVGHVDPRTTMRIYAKVCARRDRAVQGAAFDRMLDDDGRDEPGAVAA